jgi:hypothetical protein
MKKPGDYRRAQYFFRGDSRPPDVIFREGFRLKNPEDEFAAEPFNVFSGAVSVSMSLNSAACFPLTWSSEREKSYIYIISPSPANNPLDFFGESLKNSVSDSKLASGAFPYEVVFLGDIPPECILGAIPIQGYFDSSDKSVFVKRFKGVNEETSRDDANNTSIFIPNPQAPDGLVIPEYLEKYIDDGLATEVETNAPSQLNLLAYNYAAEEFHALPVGQRTGMRHEQILAKYKLAGTTDFIMGVLNESCGLINFNLEIDSQNSNYNRQSHLYFAAAKGNVDGVKLLLEKGFNPDFQGLDGFTPMKAAVMYGHKDCLVKLWESYESNYDGDNVGKVLNDLLNGAVLNGQINCAKYLLDQGADYSSVEGYGKRISEVAFSNGKWALCKMFIEYQCEYLDNETQLINAFYIDDHDEQEDKGSMSRAGNDYLQHAATYVFHHHLRHPYKEDPFDQKQVHIGVQRPNHALAHCGRKTRYVDGVIDLFVGHAKEMEFKKFCSSLKDTDKELMKIAALFEVSGRESEASFFSNSSAYLAYKSQSAENFMSYIQLHRQDLIPISEKYRDVIGHINDPSFDQKQDVTKDQIHLERILRTVHNLDLSRCFSASEFQERMKPSYDWITTNNEALMKLESLKFHSSDLIHKTDGVSGVEYQKYNSDPEYLFANIQSARSFESENALFVHVSSVFALIPCEYLNAMALRAEEISSAGVNAMALRANDISSAGLNAMALRAEVISSAGVNAMALRANDISSAGLNAMALRAKCLKPASLLALWEQMQAHASTETPSPLGSMEQLMVYIALVSDEKKREGYLKSCLFGLSGRSKTKKLAAAQALLAHISKTDSDIVGVFHMHRDALSQGRLQGIYQSINKPAPAETPGEGNACKPENKDCSATQTNGTLSGAPSIINHGIFHKPINNQKLQSSKQQHESDNQSALTVIPGSTPV